MTFQDDKSQPNLLGLLKTQTAAIYSRFISPAKNTESQEKTQTIIPPNFLYYARHAESNMKNLKSMGIMQNLINSLLKAGQTMDIRSGVLYQSSARGEIFFSHIVSKIASAKLFDKNNTSDENPITFSKKTYPF